MSVYHFWSPTCEPCKVLKPIFEDLKDEFPGLTWESINIRADPNGITQKYGVTVVPTMVVVYKDIIEKHSGSTVAGYYRILRNATR